MEDQKRLDEGQEDMQKIGVTQEGTRYRRVILMPRTSTYLTDYVQKEGVFQAAMYILHHTGVVPSIRRNH